MSNSRPWWAQIITEENFWSKVILLKTMIFGNDLSIALSIQGWAVSINRRSKKQALKTHQRQVALISAQLRFVMVLRELHWWWAVAVPPVALSWRCRSRNRIVCSLPTPAARRRWDFSRFEDAPGGYRGRCATSTSRLGQLPCADAAGR